MGLSLSSLAPNYGARKKHVRVGRGIGSGLGKTCGRGIKGSGARKSPHTCPGFEGGQMPLKIRLPKFGFWSPKAQVTAEVRLNDLQKVPANQDVIDREALLEARLITKKIRYVKVIMPEELEFTRKITLKGIGATKAAKAAIEAAGGSVEEADYVADAKKRRDKSARRSAAKLKARLDKLAADGIKRPAKKSADLKGGKKAAQGGPKK